MKNRKLSWKDITSLYPNEWVLLADYEPDIEYDGKGIIATKGRIIAHSPKRDDFDKFLKNVKVKKSAIRYTGKLVPDNFKNLWRANL